MLPKFVFKLAIKFYIFDSDVSGVILMYHLLKIEFGRKRLRIVLESALNYGNILNGILNIDEFVHKINEGFFRLQ